MIATRGVVLASVVAVMCCCRLWQRARRCCRGRNRETSTPPFTPKTVQQPATLLIPEHVSELEEMPRSSCETRSSSKICHRSPQVATIEVYGRNARVVLDSDTAFLTQAGAGWQLLAAGCVERRDRPYDCSISGG